MESKVVVLTPKGRRVNVKVTPNTTLLQILEEVCEKHGFNSEEYSLKHYNKDVPLTQMFRFSGLPNNCLLEMSQSERRRIISTVDICVQLEDGTRKQAQFNPEDNVWYVATKLLGSDLKNYENPVIIYTRQEMFGEAVMSKTTLKSLGILEGRALMRLLNKKPEDLKSQANVYNLTKPIEETPRKENINPKESHKTGSGGSFAVTQNIVQNLKNEKSVTTEKTEAMPSDLKKNSNFEKSENNWDYGIGRSLKQPSAEQEGNNHESSNSEDAEPLYNIIGERNAIVYSLDDVHVNIEDLPDSFYDLTVSDLKLILRDLKNIAAGDEDAPLLTQKLREFRKNETMLLKMAQYKNSIIRIQFPDRYVLQGMFKPVDKITDIIDFVKKFLNKSDMSFYLFTIPPKRILEEDITLLELDLVPNALIHFSYTNKDKKEEAYLKSDVLQKVSTPEAAIYAANKFRELKQQKPSPRNEGENNRPGPSTGAIPKRPRGNGEQNKT